VSLEHILFLQKHNIERLTTHPAKSTSTNLGMKKEVLALVNGHTLETKAKQGEVKRPQLKRTDHVTCTEKCVPMEPRVS
jgi:hypothetical protein